MFALKQAESKSRARGNLSDLAGFGRHDSEAKQEARVQEQGSGISWSISRVPIFADAPPPRKPVKYLQRKLVVGSVNDPLEREAEAAADRVMRVGDSARPSGSRSETKVQRKCGAGCQCDACRNNDEEEPMALSRAASAHGADFDFTAAPGIVDDVLRSSGEPLDPAARTFFESRFRRDFGDVRIHAGSRAGESARCVGAHAYTVGSNIVFGNGQYKPGTSTGRHLLAHELAHVEQQRNGASSSNERIFRQTGPEEEEEERRKKAAQEEARRKQAAAKDNPQPDAGAGTGSTATNDAGAGSATTSGTGAATTSPEAKSPADEPKQTEQSKTDTQTTPAPAADPTVTPGGHSAAPAGMAECPDAPPVNIVVVGCTAAPAAAPPAVDKVELPTLNTAPFGGDPDRAKFAKDLAQCHAARVVNGIIEKRYQAALKAAKAQATEEAKHDTEEALKKAVEDIDPKDRRAVTKARNEATAAAKKAAAKKIADAAAAVTREDIAKVTAELAAAFEKDLKEDYDKTIDALIKTSGPGWLKTQQKARDNKRANLTKEKNAKPKVPKGQEAPPAKSPEDIAKEIEAELADFRCTQKETILNIIEKVAHAWAVGRREQVDFDTRESRPYLKDFNPTYKPAAADLVPLTNPGEKETYTGVAPELNDFLNQLRADPATPPFRGENYGGHGGGSWAGMGFSVDLYLASAPLDQRGFWRHEDAVKFLLRLDATAKAMGARWRVLYNDFRVADEVNKTTGARNVGFMGGIDAKGGLNWHGPEGLKLHFHLDLEIPKKPVPTPPTTTTTPASTP